MNGVENEAGLLQNGDLQEEEEPPALVGLADEGDCNSRILISERNLDPGPCCKLDQDPKPNSIKGRDLKQKLDPHNTVKLNDIES